MSRIVVDAALPAGREAAEAPPRAVRPRRLFIDNLRWSMIVLVISMHAADTYSPFGNWYYADHGRVDPLTALGFGTYQSFLQAFFMGLLFAVSGYFSRASLLRKGAAAFLRDRAIRLGVPTLLYMLAIGPVTQYFVAGSWRPSPPSSFAREWLGHIADGEVFSESGPLWFCLALLVFSALYAALAAVASPRRRHGSARDPGPGRIIAFILAMAGTTFALRLLCPSGRAVLNMQLGDFPQYVLMFAAGLHAQRTGWPERLSAAAGAKWAAFGVLLGILGWAAIIGFGGALHGELSAYAGGWTWQAAAKALWEAWVCVSFSLGLLTLYSALWDAQGRLARFLSANAFAVYVVHPPILIAVTRLLHTWHAAPPVKFVAASMMGAAASFVFAAVIARQTPLLRRVL
ncbi:MAG TPA: acyltransferase [Stellaceae bacterium]|nr:acyltransferase [Stellaceae bacterium]